MRPKATQIIKALKERRVYDPALNAEAAKQLSSAEEQLSKLVHKIIPLMEQENTDLRAKNEALRATIKDLKYGS